MKYLLSESSLAFLGNSYEVLWTLEACEAMLMGKKDGTNVSTFELLRDDHIAMKCLWAKWCHKCCFMEVAER